MRCPQLPVISTELSIVIFFFNDTTTTEIYTLSLHDALPISPNPPAPGKPCCEPCGGAPKPPRVAPARPPGPPPRDRKSTRLNSSHSSISYAVFCLKKKNNGARAGPCFAADIRVLHERRRQSI